VTGGVSRSAPWRPGLVALDVDGTLLDYSERLDHEVRDSVRRVVDAGVPIVLATGRSAHGLAWITEELGLPPGYAIASNGAVTTSYPPVEVVESVTFDAREAVHTVLEHVPDAIVAVEVVGRGYRTNRLFPPDEISGEMWIQTVDELVAEPVTRVVIRDRESTSEDFIKLAEKLGLHGTNYYVGWTAWLDLAPEGVTKASALESLAGRLGVARSDVLAIGDGRNDVEMLAWAGRGVAMGHAPAEVRDVADAVTGSVQEHGAKAELDRWFGPAA
jgi:Cof subfamily protein (haloacid dehalogenase superfamily)